MQTNNRMLDDLARLMTDAAGLAQGAQQEMQALMRAQGERWLQSLDVVSREEFEAVKAMARKAREENEVLSQRIAALEARLGHVAEPGGR
ncbi:MAG: accessory factor UbiK family protein [Hyphomicrobiales bacterium]|nr:accessory factor UbiK family protein [Hyphomicrobiales bacterium]